MAQYKVQEIRKLLQVKTKDQIEEIKLKLSQLQDLRQRFLAMPMFDEGNFVGGLEGVKELVKRIYGAVRESKEKFALSARQTEYTHGLLQMILFCFPQKCAVSSEFTRCINHGKDATAISVEKLGRIFQTNKNPLLRAQMRDATRAFFRYVSPTTFCLFSGEEAISAPLPYRFEEIIFDPILEDISNKTLNKKLLPENVFDSTVVGELVNKISDELAKMKKQEQTKTENSKSQSWAGSTKT